MGCMGCILDRPEIFDEAEDCIHEMLIVPLRCSDLVEQFVCGERLLYTTPFKVLQSKHDTQA